MVSFSTVTAAPIKTGSKDDGLGPLLLESNLKYLLYSPPPPFLTYGDGELQTAAGGRTA